MPTLPTILTLATTIAVLIDTIPREYPGWSSALAAQGLETIGDLATLEFDQLSYVLGLAGITALVGQTNAIRAILRSNCPELGVTWNWLNASVPPAIPVEREHQGRRPQGISRSNSDASCGDPTRSSTKPLFTRLAESSVKNPLCPELLREFARLLRGVKLLESDINFILYVMALYHGLVSPHSVFLLECLLCCGHSHLPLARISLMLCSSILMGLDGLTLVCVCRHYLCNPPALSTEGWLGCLVSCFQTKRRIRTSTGN